VIRQWVMEAVGAPLAARDTDTPALAEGEVLVRVAGCGVCHTDLGFLYDGVRTNHALPLTLGHEISGVVVQAAPGLEHLVGGAVVVPAVIPCNRCTLCRAGKGLLCREQKNLGNDIHGGFADHVAVPGWPLAVVDGFTGDAGAPLGEAGLTLAELSVVADAVTTPYQAVLQSGLAPGDLAVFIGVGGVGGFGAQIAHALGAVVAAADIRDERLESLRAAGIRHTLNVKGLDGREVRDRLRAIAKAEGLSPHEWKIFETSGTAAGQDLAFKCLTYGASLSVVGFTMEPVTLRLSNLMAFHARALGNWGCHPRHYPEALRMVLDGQVQVRPFVKTFPLPDINAVFDAAHRGLITRRPILVPDSA
jgi:6-hydroxycyclohex-1-ene-1-carbonyl-CoA dehydrogenase